MDLARARYLVSAGGREALAALQPQALPADPVALSRQLRKGFAPAEAAALGEQLLLRAALSARLGGEPVPALLTRAGGEMLTHPAIARRRARRLALLGVPVFDLTCGLGGDLLACIEADLPAWGLDRDRATALLAGANTGGSVVHGDALATPFPVEQGAVILDPSRREAGKRALDPADWAPPLAACIEITGRARAGVIKVAPGIDHAAIPAHAEAEFVQLGRVLREAAIWAGGDAVPGLRRAVHLPSGDEITSPEGEAAGLAPAIGPLLYDPESCVTRAGLVTQLGARLGARLLDPRVGYLTGEVPVLTPLAAAFAVIDVMPFSVARLRTRLRELGRQPAEIRRRAFPVEPDELRRLLGPIDGEPATVLCTTLGGKRTVVIARRIERPPIAQECRQ